MWDEASVSDSGDEDFSWSDDENRKENNHSACSIGRAGEADFESRPMSSLFSHFVEMGFSQDLISKAIQRSGEENTEAVLEALLTYSVLEESAQGCSELSSVQRSSESNSQILNHECRGGQGCDVNQEKLIFSGKEELWMHLVDMGFTENEASAALDKCGPNASLFELQDFIYASKITDSSNSSYTAEQSSLESDEDEKGSDSSFNEFQRGKKRRKGSLTAGTWEENVLVGRQRKFIERYHSHDRHKKHLKSILGDGGKRSTLSGLPHMIGFGVPGYPNILSQRNICEGARGPPYFYYENVALAPKGVWEKISSFLFEIKPEFVDSKHFCAAARKRGYIHNLPISNRFPLEPRAPKTIHEALPSTRKCWPPWDHRTQLNCIGTNYANAQITEKIRISLAHSSDPPPSNIIKYVISECKKWNLVWVGVHKVAPLDPDEIEMLLGYPVNHTRGGGISSSERYRSLGNSFQVDTVAYHLSVLKDIFPNGITVLSLFSGIGGAEVALHRLGILLKTVISVEISEVNRNILRSWWDQTCQGGTLIEFSDVQELSFDKLKELINLTGGFDLVVGGSPCNNLSGRNRVSRNGLEGRHSELFYDYYRILETVKTLMGRDT
ncbi:hypothetical protein H6P81_000497 [Aristolochia fimbriata]|uniref:DNA (cytosine-5-)-methyltransferase n=1 Tax=Aristolochia fimbriata TaxID=158543 RepID=A0AAV7F5L3_ARIFI|nr:hypothetical protein H6P81_000497 [Aristolochia fimbriata]